VDECLVCGSPNVVAGGRCRTCDRFLKRTGRDRSTDEIERPLYHAITRIRGRAAGLTADFVAFVAAMVLILVVFLYIVVFKTPTMSAPPAGRHREAHGCADRARPDTWADEGALTRAA